MNQTFHTKFKEMDAYNGRFDLILVFQLTICIYYCSCCFVYMREEDNVIIYFRSQTTKGIWIAKCSDIDPFTIVMDFEGTDSNQRGEVTLRAFYYFSVALLIERGFMVILYSFQLL